MKIQHPSEIWRVEDIQGFDLQEQFMAEAMPGLRQLVTWCNDRCVPSLFTLTTRLLPNEDSTELQRFNSTQVIQAGHISPIRDIDLFKAHSLLVQSPEDFAFYYIQHAARLPGTLRMVLLAMESMGVIRNGRVQQGAVPSIQ